MPEDGYYPPALSELREITDPEQLIAKRNEIRDHFVPVSLELERVQSKFGPLQEALYIANTRLGEMGINV